MSVMENLDLKCTCGHDLVFTDKGLSCPNCERKKSIIVTRGWKVYKVLAAKNIIVSASYLTEEQVTDLLGNGVDVIVQ